MPQVDIDGLNSTLKADVIRGQAATSTKLGGTLDADSNDITNTGDVGIGTASPAAPLDIRDATLTGAATMGNPLLILGSDTDDTVLQFTQSSGNNTAQVVQFGDGDADVGAIKYNHGATDADDMMRFVAGASVMATIKNSGVGIGTTSPLSKLTVADASAMISLVDTDRSGSEYAAVWADQEGNLFLNADVDGTSSSGLISFRTGGTAAGNEVVRIAADGSVGIGTASPTAKDLHLETGALSTGERQLYIYTTDTTSSSEYFINMSTAGGGMDNQFLVRTDGTANCDGAWSGGGADYAEYFEWEDGNPDGEDRRGMAVTLDGEKIKKAVDGDTVIGIISANPASVGDAQGLKWQGKYLLDDFGGYLKEPFTQTIFTTEEQGYAYDTDRIPEDVTVPEDADIRTEKENGKPLMRNIINPDYDADMEYTGREFRQEWDAVGMVGKLRMRKGEVTDSRWIKLKDINDNIELWLVR